MPSTNTNKYISTVVLFILVRIRGGTLSTDKAHLSRVAKKSVFCGFRPGQTYKQRGARWPSGRVSDSGARGQGFDTYLRRVVSLSKDTFTPRKVLVIPRKR